MQLALRHMLEQIAHRGIHHVGHGLGVHAHREHRGGEPDLVCVAKSIASGLPLFVRLDQPGGNLA